MVEYHESEEKENDIYDICQSGVESEEESGENGSSHGAWYQENGNDSGDHARRNAKHSASGKRNGTHGGAKKEGRVNDTEADNDQNRHALDIGSGNYDESPVKGNETSSYAKRNEYENT